MGSILKKILQAQKKRDWIKRRRTSDNTNNNDKTNTKTMASRPNLIAFRIMLCLFFAAAIVRPAFAPPKGPKLPEGVSISGFVGWLLGSVMQFAVL